MSDDNFSVKKQCLDRSRARLIHAIIHPCTFSLMHGVASVTPAAALAINVQSPEDSAGSDKQQGAFDLLPGESVSLPLSNGLLSVNVRFEKWGQTYQIALPRSLRRRHLRKLPKTIEHVVVLSAGSDSQHNESIARRLTCKRSWWDHLQHCSKFSSKSTTRI